MESRNKRKRAIFSCIVGIALAFQLCGVANAQYVYYDGSDGGSPYDVSVMDGWGAFIDGPNTVVNFDAASSGNIYMGWFSPGPTLNFGREDSETRAGFIDAEGDSHVNLYGGSVRSAVYVYAGTEVTIWGDRFVVGDGLQYGPGTTLSLPYTMVTAYDRNGEPLFHGNISCGNGATVLLDSENLTVQIDVKPGSDPSAINLNSNGMVPVAVLSDETVDATKVLPETVEFAGAPVALSGSGKYMASAVDVDNDGDDDMLFHFRISDLKLEAGVTLAELTLTGQLAGESEPVIQVMTMAARSLSLQAAAQIVEGAPISGSEEVQIMQPKKNEEN